MKIATFSITGLSPLLQNNPASMGGGADSKLGIKKIPTPEEEAAAKIYRDESGVIYIPSVAFRSAMIGKGGGASGRRIGKRTAIAVISGTVFNVEPRCPLYHPKTKKPITTYRINTMRAVVQGQGVRRSRPEIPEWACDVRFEIDTDFLSAGVDLIRIVEDLLNISGKIAGVGDYRPQKKGSYGRFSAKLLD